MPGYLSNIRSSAILAIYLWHRGNILMAPPGTSHTFQPLAGTFWDRLENMAGEMDTETLARKLLGINTGLTSGGAPFGETPGPFVLPGDDQQSLKEMVNQIDEDALSGNIMTPGPSRFNNNNSPVPRHFHIDFDANHGPFGEHRRISRAQLINARRRPATSRTRRPAPRRTST